MVKRIVSKRSSSSNGKAKKGNSIVIETKMERMDSLNRYYENPRIGDPAKTAESLKKNGQFRSIVVNVGTKTGRPREILAGNHTHMGAERLKWDYIQVDWVDVSESHARRIVLADNGSSDGSTYHDDVLARLLQAEKDATGTLVGTTYDDDVLNRLVKDVDEDPRSKIDRIEDAPEEDGTIRNFNNFVYFDSDLPYEIPPLLLDGIPDKLPGPIDVWAGHEVDLPRQEQSPDQWWLTVWHTGCRGVNWSQAIPCFYTEDFHFDPVYNDPSKNTKKILNLGITYTMMPNYTIAPEMPTALWVWATYRSYFVARFFQEAGLMVIPDIQTGNTDEVLDLSLSGIPKGAGIVSAQAQTTTDNAKQYIRTKAYLLKEAEDRLEFKNLIMYGHKAADEVLNYADLKCNIIRVDNRSSRRREYLNSGATINTQKVTTGRRKRRVSRGPS